jgi:hypothetical protein
MTSVGLRFSLRLRLMAIMTPLGNNSIPALMIICTRYALCFSVDIYEERDDDMNATRVVLDYLTGEGFRVIFVSLHFLLSIIGERMDFLLYKYHLDW